MRTIRVGFVFCCLIYCFAPPAIYPQTAAQFESLLSSAKDAQANSDFQAAAEFYRQAATLRPEIPELKANLGLMYYQVGNDELASDAFRQALRLKADLFVPNLFLGLELVKARRFAQAIPYFNHAALKKPSDVQVQLGLGQAYAGSGRTRLATAAYTRASQLQPGNADAWYHLGVSYLEQVEADARILLTRHKDSAYVQALMAETFTDLRAFIQAEDAYKKVLAVRNPLPNAHAGYGFVLLNRHELAAAEMEFKAEVAENPGSLVAKLGMARLHLEQGISEQAAQEFAEVWKNDHGFLRANISLFCARLPLSKREELLGVLERRQSVRDLPEPLVNLFRSPSSGDSTTSSFSSLTESAPAPKARPANASAQKLYASGRYGECSDTLASVARPLQVRELQLLASCSFLTGEYARALDAAAKLAANAVTEVEGLYWETKSAQKLASYALARASTTDPGSPKLHVLLGDVYRQQRAFPDAEQEYRKALALRPEDSGALFGLSLAMLADGDSDGALSVAQAALTKDPEDPELNAVMGEILCARNDFSAAEPYLKKSLNTKPEYISRVHALLGNVYAKTDRTEQAIAELKLGLSSDKDGSLHYQLARLYMKTGDSDSAKQAFEVSKQLQEQGLMRATVAMQQGEDSSELQ
ncbi:MAG: tetratricopeptide repeat protein [Acidobacteriia bacterium]|nr:tetratricopeptide repeat protein [Terriglobia bacterium]